jgi:hypothetical protein
VNAADLLFPRELEFTPTPLKHVVIIGSCLAESYYSSFAKLHPGPQSGIRFEFRLFNNIHELSPLEGAPDFVYIQIPLRSVLPDAVVRFVEYCDEAKVAAMKEHALNALEAMLESALSCTRKQGTTAFVSAFILPQRAPCRSLADAGTGFDLSTIITSLNRRMRALIAKEANVYVAETDQLASAFGKNYLLDDWCISIRTMRFLRTIGPKVQTLLIS